MKYRPVTKIIVSLAIGPSPVRVGTLMDAKGGWRASPAYDLTYSRGPGGEQSTMVMGEGKIPGRPHLLQLADKFGITKTNSAVILEQVAEAVGNWKSVAREAGVSKVSIKAIAAGIQPTK